MAIEGSKSVTDRYRPMSTGLERFDFGSKVFDFEGGSVEEDLLLPEKKENERGDEACDDEDNEDEECCDVFT